MIVILLWAHLLLEVGGAKPHLSVPRTATAVEGSCVVIGCTLISDDPLSALHAPPGFWRFGPARLWSRGRDTVTSDLPALPPSPAYRGRSRLMGTLRGGRCSVLLEDVRASDGGAYVFGLRGVRRYSYPEQAVALKVIAPPAPALTVAVEDWVRATCSAVYHCEDHPPQISWSTKVDMFHVNQRRHLLRAGHWRLDTSVSIPLSASLFNKKLTCTAIYRGGRQASTSAIVK